VAPPPAFNGRVANLQTFNNASPVALTHHGFSDSSRTFLTGDAAFG